MPQLTSKRVRFIEEYLIDSNATQAAVRAGYSPKTAYSQGQRLLKNVEVAAAIEFARAVLTERTGLSAEWAIRKLAQNGLDALELHDHGPANRAFELVGQHFGAFPAARGPALPFVPDSPPQKSVRGHGRCHARRARGDDQAPGVGH